MIMQLSFNGDKTDDKRLKTGTTTIGLVYKDGVIIGTESQATAGFTVASKTAQKLFKINDYAAATISGGVADCQYVVNQARALANLREIETGNPADLKYIANVVRNVLYQGRSYFLSLMIVGGFSQKDDQPKLYGLDLLGALYEEAKFLSYGSGSPFALGALESEWKPDLTETKAVEIAKKSITSAKTRDAGSGYDIQLVKITKAGFKPIQNFHDD